jgi:V8-like Glu-specific endopeptidase
MNVDEYVALENKPENVNPLHIEPTPVLYISSQPSTNAKLDVQQNISAGIWEVKLGKDFVIGRLGKHAEAEKLPIPEKPPVQLTLKPFVPPEGGITYHPKLSAEHPVRRFRRNKGKRVVPHYIFGNDDRQVYVPNGYPWRCIGKLLVWKNSSSITPSWSGTGTLVGENLVLTASHVCPWGFSSWMIQFIPAFYDGVSLVGVSSYVESYRGYKDHGQGDDMAVLKLYTPLGKTLGWFGSKTYNDSWEDGNYWTKCGYAGAVAMAQRPNWIRWFPIIDDDNDGAGVELEYHADASDGDSGGPVFGWWSGEPYVIGTHSGGEEEYQFPFSVVKNNVAAGGSALPNLIKEAQATL